MAEPVRQVVIVGGGTAGWLTASLLAADHCASTENGLKVTLIESPGVPILGVGEGTWPSLRDTLRRIGLSETEFVRRCDASFKQGSRFDGWITGQATDSYFHPFSAPPNTDQIDPLSLWRTAGYAASFAETVTSQVALCLAGKAPKQPLTPEYAAVANYAYHLDATSFAELLEEHATRKLGVRHISDHVVAIESGRGGDIQAVQTEEHGEIAGDLFIDCTGMRALLIGQHFGVDPTDVSHVLINDRALAVHVPYPDDQAPIASQTNGTALEAGWVWDIGLQSRRGVGYVHSSRFTNEAQARQSLTNYLTRTAPGSRVTGEDARLIEFRSVYRETPWHKNCVAVGMSSGFVEPLEASAIVMVELSAQMISDTLPRNKQLMQKSADRFNQRFAYRWSRIVDFLKLHYILSRRTEPYWQHHQDRTTWPNRLTELMDLWRFEPPSREDFTQIQEIFPAASYAFVLYGMGFETEAPPTLRQKDSPARARQYLKENQATVQKFLSGLPTNRQLIDHIRAHGLPPLQEKEMR